MSETLPRSITKAMQFENGVGIGISNRWEKGQYCTIITSVGIEAVSYTHLTLPPNYSE